jgi:hypothetical protein
MKIGDREHNEIDSKKDTSVKISVSLKNKTTKKNSGIAAVRPGACPDKAIPAPQTPPRKN